MQESPNSSSDVLPGNDSTDGLEEVQDKQPCSSIPDTTKQTTATRESPLQPIDMIATTITTTPTGKSVSSTEDPEVLSSHTSNKETNEEEEKEIVLNCKKIQRDSQDVWCMGFAYGELSPSVLSTASLGQWLEDRVQSMIPQ